MARPIPPELRHAAITDTLKVIVRDLITIVAQTSGTGRDLSNGLRGSVLTAIQRAQVDEQDHLADVRQAMKDFHKEFFDELDQAMTAVETQARRKD